MRGVKQFFDEDTVCGWTMNVFVNVITESIVSVFNLMVSVVVCIKAPVETNAISIIFIRVEAYEDGGYVLQVSVYVNHAEILVGIVIVSMSTFIDFNNNGKMFKTQQSIRSSS